MATRRPPPLPDIDLNRCTGCGWCVAACHLHLLTLEQTSGRKHSALHDSPSCTGCGKCERRCPFQAIEMRPVITQAPERVTTVQPPDN